MWPKTEKTQKPAYKLVTKIETNKHLHQNIPMIALHVKQFKEILSKYVENAFAKNKLTGAYKSYYKCVQDQVVIKLVI